MKENYQHMRELGFEHFRILLVREYKDISKERLNYKEDKYIKRYDSVNKGLNSKYAFGNKCEHNVSRSICKQCRGVSICEHNIRKCVCKYCGGSQICEHNKPRFLCKDCRGKSTCEHSTEKRHCKICSPAVCNKCLKVYAGKSNLKRHQNK